MSHIALVALLIFADPVQVPVVGRPSDFSGAIGGPFQIAYELTCDSTIIGEPFTVAVNITGPGDLSQLKPRDWLSDPVLRQRIVIEGDATQIPGPHGVRITSTLRASQAGMIRFPRLKFVYYNPKLRAWQTVYADAVDVFIRPDALPLMQAPLKQALPQFAMWYERVKSDAEAKPGQLSARVQSMMAAIGLSTGTHVDSVAAQILLLYLLPIVICVGVCRLWVRKRRDRSSVQHRAIEALRKCSPEDVDRVGLVLREYLIQGLGIAEPYGVQRFGGGEEANCPVIAALMECDRAKFGPQREAALNVKEAARLAILSRGGTR